MRVKLIIALLLVICSSASLADYDAANLGNLFTDKSKRTQIDAARSGSYSADRPKQTNKVSISGYVTRSDGKGVVWINDKNTLNSSRVGNVRVQQSTIGKNKKVTVSVDGKSRGLKAGQTWHKETGKIIDNQ